jgi:putative membrane protein
MQHRPEDRRLEHVMYGEHMDAGGWFLSVLVTVLVVALIVAGIVWLLRTQSPSAPRPEAAEHASARDVLDRRLASGQIDEDEYRRLRSALTDDSSAVGRPAAPV